MSFIRIGALVTLKYIPLYHLPDDTEITSWSVPYRTERLPRTSHAAGEIAGNLLFDADRSGVVNDNCAAIIASTVRGRSFMLFDLALMIDHKTKFSTA